MMVFQIVLNSNPISSLKCGQEELKDLFAKDDLHIRGPRKDIWELIHCFCGKPSSKYARKMYECDVCYAYFHPECLKERGLRYHLDEHKEKEEEEGHPYFECHRCYKLKASPHPP